MLSGKEWADIEIERGKVVRILNDSVSGTPMVPKEPRPLIYRALRTRRSRPSSA
jgi:hypothetical protein